MLKNIKNSPKASVLKMLIPIILLILLGNGLILRDDNIQSVTARSPDESVYTYQAGVIVEFGLDGFRHLINEYNANKKLWHYPLPYRAGYLLAVSSLMKTSGKSDIKMGAYLSGICSVFSLVLLCVIGFRFFNRWIALIGLLFLSVSPMDMAIARRTWQDSMIGFIGVLLIYFSLEILRSRKNILWQILFIVTGSYSFLVKETGTAVYGLCILWVIFVFVKEDKSYLKGAVFGSAALLGLGLSALYLSGLVGGMDKINQALTNYKSVMATASYGAKYCSGPWYQIIKGFWILNPVNTYFWGGTILISIFAPSVLPDKVKHLRGAVLFLSAVMLSYVAIVSYLPNLKNLRYMSSMYVPFYLISAVGWYVVTVLVLDKLKEKSLKAMLISGVVISMLLISNSCLKRFDRMIVKTGVKDLAIVSLNNIRVGSRDY